MRDEPLLDRLGALRRRIRLMLIIDGVGMVLAVGMICVLLAAIVDYLMWLPGVARVVVAVCVCAGVAVAAWTHVVRPIITRIGVGEVAAVLDTRFGELEDRLASAVGFAELPRGASAAMVRRVVAQANEAAGRLPLGTVVRWRRPLLMLVAAGGVAGGVVGVAAAAPWFVTTGLQRYIDPFGSVQWPRRVLVEPASQDATRPVGGWFEARARVVRGQDTSLRVYVHTEADDGHHEQHAMTFDAKRGQYFHAFQDLRQGFSYWFEAGDDSTLDRGGRFRVVVVPRPAVVQATLTLTDPPYVASTQPRSIVLQDAPAQAVAGSRARLDVLTNKPLRPAESGPSRATLTLPDGARLAMTSADESGRRFSASFDVERAGPMSVGLVDENGFDNRGGTTYTLAVRQDEPPHVVIVEPQSVTEVTPSATLGVVVSADDDFRVTQLAVEASTVREQSSAPKAFDLSDRMRLKLTSGRAAVSVSWSWDLRPMALKPGDVVTYRALARDNYELQGRRHPPSRSAEMRLKVISAEQLANRVRDELMLLKGALRQMLVAQEAARDQTETIQGDMNPVKGLGDLDRESVAQLAGRQARLASRARYLGGRFSKLVDRLDVNRSKDPDVRERSSAASRRLASLASGEMTQAADQLGQASREKASAGQVRSLRSAGRSQKNAAEELRSLLASMDRWGDFQDVVRHVQQMLDEQERLTESTQQLGRKTLGRRVEDLPAELGAGLRQRSRQQRRLADDAERLSENMARLSRAIGKGDAAAAAALDDARQAAESGQVVSKMRASADAVDQNRMAQAQAGQREAEQAVREMLDRLQRRQTQQLEELSKRLKGAVEKVQALIEDQKKLLEETKGLASAKEGDAQREALARRQQGLARSAEAVSQEVAKVDRASRPARGIQRASGRMNRASSRLDQNQPDQAAAEQAEAVRQLTEALETLEKLRAQAEAEMAAKTLKAIVEEMKALRERQAALNERLTALVQQRAKGKELSRVELRRLDKMAREQREVAASLEKLRIRVQTARVYDYVMRRISADMGRLAGRFDDRRVADESTKLAAHILKRLDQLLVGLQQKPDEDSEQDQFADGGGGQGGTPTRDKPVPTVAELVVLRELQADLNRRTQQADMEHELIEQTGEEQLEALRRLGREQEQVRALTEDIVRQVRRRR